MAANVSGARSSFAFNSALNSALKSPGAISELHSKSVNILNSFLIGISLAI